MNAYTSSVLTVNRQYIKQRKAKMLGERIIGKSSS
ncbi:hypothetical protein T4D_14938 [Trichinella pseudospiralis]|uniref:Uncharacterized protein n=1 Tax=Trichinella pseudospiralis TaxID=6337 RepID=A0A0V1DNS1_TRIPS|nr:hypothetical protein T4D_14938 [Trichinella pseudospiralis]